ncbi:MAG: hypothetical protein ACLFRV_10000 [Acidimicrobiales bacterium]
MSDSGSTDPLSPGDTPREHRPLDRRRLKVLVLTPLVAVVGVVVLLLGVPWPLVVAALVLFVLWLVFEG